MTYEDAMKLGNELLERYAAELNGTDFVLACEDLSELAYVVAENYREAHPVPSLLPPEQG